MVSMSSQQGIVSGASSGLRPADREPVLSADTGGPDQALALELVRVTEAAALAAGDWVGRGDEDGGKAAAVVAMHEAVMSVSMRGVVVIGDGDHGDAIALSRGADVGTGNGPTCDVGIAAGDGALSMARDVPHALSAIAVTERLAMYQPAPGLAMQKLAVGSDYAGVVDIGRPVVDNIHELAWAKDTCASDVTVAVLNRPWHRQLVRDIREAGARVHLIEGGEIAGAIAAAHPSSPVDMLLGTGGADEAVMAAAALSCMGGSLQAVLRPGDHGRSESAQWAGSDVGRVLRTEDLVRGQRILFCATGVTGSELLRGVGRQCDRITTESIVMCSNPGTVRIVSSEHHDDSWDDVAVYSLR